MSILRNGRMGIIAGFESFQSNLLATASDGGNTCFSAIFCQRSALTFAAQMTKMESLRSENTFGTIVRGLNVYGYKVLKGTAIGELYIRKGV